MLSINATRIITVEIADHSVCAVIQIQVTSALHVETGTVGIRRIRNQFEVDVIQTQVCAGDQVGRAAILIGMDMRINVQREILKRNVTAACIDANPFQRQLVGTAAGNGQGLVIERKTFIQLNVLQQVDLVARYRHADRLVQCRVVNIADLAHRRGCGAAVVVRRGIALQFLVKRLGGGGIPCGQVIRCFIAVRVRRVIATRFLVKSFGGGIPCGQVIRCCFIAVRVRRVIATRFLVRSFGGEIHCGPVIRCFFIVVRIRKAFPRACLRKAGSSRAGFCIHDSRVLFLRIIKDVGNGGKVTPVQNGAVRIRDGGVGAQCKYTQRQNMKQQSDGKYHYEPSLFHIFFLLLFLKYSTFCVLLI